MTWLAVIASFALGMALERARARYRVTKRKAQADELRFVLALTIPQSVEDAVRRSGC
jgi:hypothetical protein